MWDGSQNDGSEVNSGIYYYQIKAGNKSRKGKVVKY